MSQTTRTSPRMLAPSSPPVAATWKLHILVCGDELHVGSVQRLSTGRFTVGRGPDPNGHSVAIDDPTVSRSHFHLTVKGGTSPVQVEDACSRNGTFVGGRPVRSARAGHGAVIRAGGLVAVLESDQEGFDEFALPTPDVPGRSGLARRVRGELDAAAKGRLPVLLYGATGTGKELAAAELHRRSGRRGRLVRLNVAAVPDTLFESELFGHVRGSFTGADQQRFGRFREADGGTLVLDEIGALPLAQQAKLLRVVEEHSVRPVGGERNIGVDVLLCASTNADLRGMVRQGMFRADLLARLSSLVVTLPTIADRKPDLLELANAVYPLEHGGRVKPWERAFTADAVEVLLLHTWPTGLRELRSALLRASSWESGGLIGPSGLPSTLLANTRALATNGTAAGEPTRRSRMRAPDADELHGALRRYRGNISAVSREYGVGPRQIYRWLSYRGIEATHISSYRK